MGGPREGETKKSRERRQRHLITHYWVPFASKMNLAGKSGHTKKSVGEIRSIQLYVCMHVFIKRQEHCQGNIIDASPSYMHVFIISRNK